MTHIVGSLRFCGITASKKKNFHWALENTVRNKRGCREWIGARNREGYAAMGYHGKVIKVARFMWEQIFGKIPGGMWICHHCDNPRCVSPYHLFLGTAADNARDRAKKGR